MSVILEATSLRKQFPSRRNLLGRVTNWTQAVKDVSIHVSQGETLGILGESGAGKSTVGRMVLRLIEPDAGRVMFDGVDLLSVGKPEMRSLRARARMIFQDPFVSLDPSMTVGASIGEPLAIHEKLQGRERRNRVLDLLVRVGLNSEHADRYPSQFSGGQLQRVAVARAIATNPDLIVCDEPVAALDMSIRAQVINLLRDLQQERGIALVFISHDLSLVHLIADRIAVMYRGRVVETGPGNELFERPMHPYTQSLMEAIPVPDPRARRALVTSSARSIATDGQLDLQGCDYADRCPNVIDRCRIERPEPRRSGGLDVACHLVPGDAVPVPVEIAVGGRQTDDVYGAASSADAEAV